MQRLTAVLFDLDGLLIDTETLAMGAFAHALTQLGQSPDDAFFKRLIGLTADASSAMLVERFGPDFPLDIYRTHTRAHYDSVVAADGIAAKPGAREIAVWLRARSIPYAIATSSAHQRARVKLAAAGLEAEFEAVVGGDEVVHGKPAPDIYLKAARLLDAAPHECLVFEDSLNGLRAARAAGATAVMIPDLIAPDEHTDALAHAVLDSLHDGIDLMASLSTGVRA